MSVSARSPHLLFSEGVCVSEYIYVWEFEHSIWQQHSEPTFLRFTLDRMMVINRKHGYFANYLFRR